MENTNYTDYYLNKQLDFDKTLIKYRYETNKQFFKGSICLEMGPADGVMTKYLINDFSHLDIIDSDIELLNTIPHYGNIKKIHSWFEDFNPSQQYDTIIMEHIIEHIINPKEILLKVYNWLKPDGVLIAGVPNAKSIHRLVAVKMGLLNSEFELNDRDKSQGHQRVYDILSFSNEFLNCGFKILQKGGVFFKPLSNFQIDSQWSSEMIEGFYKLGKDFPDNAADIFIVANK